MSKDFAHFMASISEDSAEQRITELMEILEKVMHIINNSVDGLYSRLMNLDQGIQGMMQRVVECERRPIAPFPGTAPAGAPGVPAPAAPPPPKPAPKPMSPMAARSALQGELKALFNKRKQR